MTKLFPRPDVSSLIIVSSPTSWLSQTWFTLQGDLIGCRTKNGEKLSSSQAELGQAINSAVA